MWNLFLQVIFGNSLQLIINIRDRRWRVDKKLWTWRGMRYNWNRLAFSHIGAIHINHKLYKTHIIVFMTISVFDWRIFVAAKQAYLRKVRKCMHQLISNFLVFSVCFLFIALLLFVQHLRRANTRRPPKELRSCASSHSWSRCSISARLKPSPDLRPKTPPNRFSSVW